MATKYIGYLLTIGIALTACNPVLYSPVGQNVPLFKEKGEIALNTSICFTDSELSTWGGGSYAQGFSAQGAFALDSNLAIIGSLYRMKDDEEAGADITGHGQYIEFGIGKFWPIKDSRWIGEVFIGTGFGSIENKVTMEDLNVRYFKPFIQPSIGFRA